MFSMLGVWIVILYSLHDNYIYIQRAGKNIAQSPTVSERTTLQNCEERRLKRIGERRWRATTAILATVVTDTHLLDFIFIVSIKTPTGWRRRKDGSLVFFPPLLRLNSKSGCGSEGIHSLHPLSDWCWDYYVRWKRLKVTKLGFISRCVLSAWTCQGGILVV